MKTCPNCGRQYEDNNTLCPNDGAVLKRDGDDRLIGQLLAGKYRVEKKLAEGGMGCVYRATHVLMEKTVAVKVLHAALSADDKIVARFTREAKAASRISHPHALTVTDFGESEEGVVFLVMEYLDGRTLKEVIRAEGPMPLARVSEIIRQVSGALQAAHDQGVVHRDLKSDNIMLMETGDGDWAKVLDFGIAKITDAMDGKTDPGLTAPNLVIGTPQYMSPEQCGQSSEIDARSDIYSLGVILFEMLVGHVPFTGDSPTAIMMKHMQEPAPSILEERRDLPAEVGRVVAHSLAKSPDERYQTAPELSDAIAAALLGAPPVSTAAGVAVQRDTDRIIVPTDPNRSSPHTTAGEADEMTVVSGEVERGRSGEALPPSFVAQPDPSPGLNLGRIALYSVAALAVVFALVFAFQRDGGIAESDSPVPQQTPGVDGVPAQSLAPPTGQDESDLVPTATPAAATGDAGGGQTLPDPGSFSVGDPAPTPGGSGANTNTGGGREPENEDEEEPKPTPDPKPTETPRPAVIIKPDEPPPALEEKPKPTPRRPQPQQPRPTPDTTEQSERGGDDTSPE